MLKIWYLIGSRINKFLKNNKVSPEEEKLFWDNLYGRSSIINKTIPVNKISKTRNDFWIASLLARHPLNKLQKIGLSALWREIVTYKAFRDERVLNWVLKKIEQSLPRTRDEVRPFLKSVSARLKRIDTTVLNDRESYLLSCSTLNSCSTTKRRAYIPYLDTSGSTSTRAR